MAKACKSYGGAGQSSLGELVFAILVVIIFFGILIAGCEPRGTPVKPTRQADSFTIAVNLGSQQEIAAKCASFGVNENVQTNVERGCTRFFLDRNHCEVYAPRPEFVDDAATTVLGHEVLHCIAGKYHQ
jgi:hypothetical protein